MPCLLEACSIFFFSVSCFFMCSFITSFFLVVFHLCFSLCLFLHCYLMITEGPDGSKWLQKKRQELKIPTWRHSFTLNTHKGKSLNLTIPSCGSSGPRGPWWAWGPCFSRYTWDTNFTSCTLGSWGPKWTFWPLWSMEKALHTLKIVKAIILCIYFLQELISLSSPDIHDHSLTGFRINAI